MSCILCTHLYKVRVTMENTYKKVLAKIVSVDINLTTRKNKTNLTVTMDFLLEHEKTEHVTIDFANSSLRFFNFLNILLHVVEVKKWSQLAGEKVFVLYDKNSIYRICNAKDDKLFLDFSEFFHVDC
jgi:hypothetical protein